MSLISFLAPVFGAAIAQAVTIDAVYFGQTHVLKASDSYFGLVGNREALIKVHVTDPAKDGIANGVKMVIGGNPELAMDTALLPTIERINADPDGDTTFADYLLFTYRRSNLSVTAGVTAACETNTGLAAPWTPAAGIPSVVIQVDDNFTFTPPTATATDRVRVYVPRGSNPV